MSDGQGLESPRHNYTVHEPDDTGDVGSQRSDSLDGSEQFRFSMADMEAYLHILQTDRCVSLQVMYAYAPLPRAIVEERCDAQGAYDQSI